MSDSSFGFSHAIWEDHLSGTKYKSPYVVTALFKPYMIRIASGTFYLPKNLTNFI